MARERYLIGVDQSELQPSPPPKKITFWQVMQNLWAGYKWPFILGFLVLAGIIYFIVTSASKVTADYTLVMVTQKPLNSMVLDDVGYYLEDYGIDLNGDGKVKVQVTGLAMNNMASQAELAAVFSSGSNMFFAFEPSCYQSQVAAKESGKYTFFRKLDVKSSDLSADGRYWDWKNNKMQTDAVRDVPQSMYFGVRAAEGTAAGKSNEKISDQCKTLLEHYIH